MKRYIRQILLGTLLLGSACTNHQEVIEGDTSVSVVFKTRQLPSTKGENDDEISVLIFRKEKDQFTKVESIQESHGFSNKNNCRRISYCQQGSIDFCWQKDSQTPRETLGKYHL